MIAARRVLLAAAVLLALPVSGAEAAGSGESVRPVLSEKLPNVPGKSVTAVLVEYAPGGRSGSHRHAGTVVAYVLSGAIRSQLDDGPAKVSAPARPSSSRRRRIIASATAPPSPRASWPW